MEKDKNLLCSEWKPQNFSPYNLIIIQETMRNLFPKEKDSPNFEFIDLDILTYGDDKDEKEIDDLEL